MSIAFLAAVVWAAPPVAADRAAAAEAVFKQVQTQHSAGLATAEVVYTWSLRVREARRASGDAGAATAHLDRMRALLAATERMAASGSAPSHEVEAARFYVLEAELPAPATPSPSSSPQPTTAPGDAAPIEACFRRCDDAWNACNTEAEHLRLGVGAVGKDAECATVAEATCGAGRSQTLTECRDREVRACAAARAKSTCAKEQALCSARCR